MDSFYGGKQGISFVIKDSFKTIAAMEVAFTNPEYNKTWYGEYVIIDADNRNDPNNGKVFRRTAYRGEASNSSDTADNTNVTDIGTSHAEYVGQIVGPAGGIPNIELVDLNTLEANFDALRNAMPSGSIINYSSKNNNIDGTTTTATVTAGNVISAHESAIGDIYKSGAEYTTTPTFKYGFYTFQGNTKQQSNDEFPIAITKIGFEIPYIDFEFDSAVNVLPYSSDVGSVEQIIDSEHHDFYRKYKLSIPRGAPGSYFSNFKKQSNSSINNSWYNLNNIDYSNNTLKTDAQKTTVTSSSRIVTGNYYYYDSTQNMHIPLSDTTTTLSTPIDFYLWDAHEVTTITPVTDKTKSDFGKLYIDYSDTPTSEQYNLGLLRTLEAKTNVADNEYVLNAYYGTSTAATEIGRFAKYFGVWAQPLEIDSTVTATIPPTVKSTITPSTDTTSTNYPVGNLGILSDNDTSYFYMWVPSDWNNPNSSGSWQFMGATDNTGINLDIIEEILDKSNDEAQTQYKFNTKSTLSNVIFNGRAKPLSALDILLFKDMPWK